MKHFSYFVQPGGYRINTSGDWSNKLGFLNSNGEIIVVVWNSHNSNRTVTIKIGDAMVQPVVPANSFNTFVLNIEPHYNAPTPDIKVNGEDEPISIMEGDTLSVIIELDPGTHTGVQADWWCVADTPFGWYYHDHVIETWLPGFHVSYQGPLVAVSPPIEVLNMSDLPMGSYTFYFGVDGNRNSNFDEPSFYDSVEVNITPP